MFRVAAAYAVLAWLLLQIVNTIAPILDLPPWVARAFLLLLVIGFPVALFFAWMRELAPSDPASRAAASNIDYALIAALVLVIALVSYDQLVPTGTTAPAEQQATGSSPAAPLEQAAKTSIAVLPFANLSSDPEQEFFSDGITEEITSVLAKIPDLGVVARTSAFQFKGENRDLRAVGQSLGATHLLEGSVRKAGDQLRITAQLIQADNGLHVWTATYDRNLIDIFAVQEEIAQAIAASLSVPLLRQSDGPQRSRTTEPVLYEQFLIARALIRAPRSRPGAVSDAVRMLEEVTTRDPGYAPAWALLALTGSGDVDRIYGGLSERPIEESRRMADSAHALTEVLAQRAIALDRDLPDGYVALARVREERGELIAAEDLYLRARALDPDNPDTLDRYSGLLAGVGRLREALTMKRRVLVLEPFVPGYVQRAAWVVHVNGEHDAAIDMFRSLLPINRGPLLGNIYASLGRFAEAADEIRNPETANLLRSAPAKFPSPQTIPPLNLTTFIFLYVGAPERFLEQFERQVEANLSVPVRNSELWTPTPAYAAVRKTERFKALARNSGLVEYWRAKGWPAFCRPMGADDFVCE